MTDDVRAVTVITVVLQGCVTFSCVVQHTVNLGFKKALAEMWRRRKSGVNF